MEGVLFFLSWYYNIDDVMVKIENTNIQGLRNHFSGIRPAICISGNIL